MHSTSRASGMILGQLLTNEITDPRILNAMAAVPREYFVPEHLKHCAYVDEDLDIGGGRYLLEPLVIARLLDLAGLTPACRVLCVGGYNGYLPSILARLSGQITAIDTDEKALSEAREHYKRQNIHNVQQHKVKSLVEGYGLSAPYDAIIVNGAVQFVPEALGEQLGLSGKLVAVHQKKNRPGAAFGLGKIILVRRINSKLQYREYSDAATALLLDFTDQNRFEF